MSEKTYICIDLKCFYASVECVDKGLDPFKSNLVVANPTRGRGGICLAISPALKARGIKNRCRLFEIPTNIEYITAMPRMRRYMEVSAQIYSVYLKYIAPEDIHIYSIDECFIDATPYIKLYNKTGKEFAKMLIDAVLKETGICAAAGIGTNLFLAKIALDITAKKNDDHIGYLDERIFKKDVWFHQPLADIWGIGRGISKRLAVYGIYDLHGITKIEEEVLYKEFGVNAEILIDHAYGKEC
ncbi:DNA repair protein, partial [bacterium]|nr:DNA repair protein [bacterium]